MKLSKATAIIRNRSSMLTMTAMMILYVVTLQVFLQFVEGAIVCGGTPGSAPDVNGVCLKDTNTFLCNDNADACSDQVFTGVQGTTSKCNRPTPTTPDKICDSSTFYFDDTETKEQGITCEGNSACYNFYVEAGDEAERGTLTCKGGTVNSPACRNFNIYVDCLICDGPFSCFNFCFFEGRASENPLAQCYPYFFQGTLGVNCPEEKKKSKPALPACLSGTNTVEVQDKGLVTVDSLKVGDCVKTGITDDGHSQFSPLMSHIHKDTNTVVEYLQIFTKYTLEDPLEISSDHFLYLSNNKVVCAKDVQVGDILKGGSTHMVVTHINKIQRQGLYAPVTEDGTIWVSGVSASSYISMLDNNIVSPNKQALLSHMALAPLRIVCKMGSFSICKDETYSEDGYSMNLLTLIKFGLQFLALSSPMQFLMLMITAPVLLILAGLEMAIVNPGILIIVVCVGLIVTMSKMKKITKK